MDEYDYKAWYERERANNPDFERIREDLAGTVAEEMPDKADDFNTNYETFMKGYQAVRRAHFNRFDPELAERSRRGDIDASQEMLIKAGIIDSLKE